MPNFIVKNRHGNIYYCRFKSPAHLAAKAGFRELRRSLKTSDRREAIVAARAIRVIFDQFLLRISMMDTQNDTTLQDEMIERINKVIRLVRTHSPSTAARLTPDEALEIADQIDARKAKSDQQVIDGILDEIHPESRLQTQPPTADIETPAPQAQDSITAPLQGENKPTLLETARAQLQLYAEVEEKQKASRRYRDLKTAIKQWEKHVGDIPLHTLNAEIIRQYISGMADGGITPGGQKERLGAMKRMLDKQSTNRSKCLNGANPFEEVGVRVTPDDRKTNEKRSMFTSQDVLAILNSDARSRYDNYLYWLPLLAAYTGARKAELLYLSGGAVLKCPTTGLWYFDFQIERNPKGVAVRSLKNPNSARRTPIHSEIIKAGFLDFAKQFADHQLIFWPGKSINDSDINYEDIRSYTENTSGKLTTHILKPAGVHVNNVKTFHSLRHTVINHLSLRGVSLELIQRLVGHFDKKDKASLSAVTETHYLKERDVFRQLHDVVELIDYSEAIT